MKKPIYQNVEVNNTTLSEKWINFLLGKAQSGQGYHIAEIILKNGDVYKDVIILDHHCIQDMTIDVENIESITVPDGVEHFLKTHRILL